MATKKTTKKPAPKPAAKAAAKPMAHMHEGDCCATGDSCCAPGCGGWGVAARLWWSVAWRTFVWVSLPVMLVQFGMAALMNPGMPFGFLNFAMMMVMNAPRALWFAMHGAEFWFFLAVTVYSLIGAIYVYGHLICKGKFLGIKLDVERDCK